jgi:hypothetical protein
VKWLFNDDQVQVSNCKCTMAGDTYSFVIEDFQTNNVGRYTIAAENPSGKTTCSADIVLEGCDLASESFDGDGDGVPAAFKPPAIETETINQIVATKDSIKPIDSATPSDSMMSQRIKSPEIEKTIQVKHETRNIGPIVQHIEEKHITNKSENKNSYSYSEQHETKIVQSSNDSRGGGGDYSTTLIKDVHNRSNVVSPQAGINLIFSKPGSSRSGSLPPLTHKFQCKTRSDFEETITDNEEEGGLCQCSCHHLGGDHVCEKENHHHHHCHGHHHGHHHHHHGHHHHHHHGHHHCHHDSKTSIYKECGAAFKPIELVIDAASMASDSGKRYRDLSLPHCKCRSRHSFRSSCNCSCSCECGGSSSNIHCCGGGSMRRSGSHRHLHSHHHHQHHQHSTTNQSNNNFNSSSFVFDNNSSINNRNLVKRENYYDSSISDFISGGENNNNRNFKSGGSSTNLRTTTIEEQHIQRNIQRKKRDQSFPTMEMTIDMKSPPSIEVPLKNVNTIEGQSIKLECVVSGKPIPIVKWYIEGKEIEEDVNNNINIVFEPDSGVATLYIKNVSPKDAVRYTCVARNALGSCSTSANVNVQGIF